jgi:hypothetical protein
MKITRINECAPNGLAIAFRLSLRDQERWTTATPQALRAIAQCIPHNTPNRLRKILSLISDAE